MYDAMMAETVTITGTGGDPVEAYLARPLGPGPYGGVVVIHHNPGYDEATKEYTRRIAAHGYQAICPNLFTREAPGASPDDAAAAARAQGGVADEQFLGDMAGAVAYLRALTTGNGKIGAIGFCSGGRQAFLAACSMPLDAAVNLYGGLIVPMASMPPMAGPPPKGMPPMKVRPIPHVTKDLSCPLLGLFGSEDRTPSPEDVAKHEELLKEHGKTYDFHVYQGVGHEFFAPDRPSYHPEAANDGWRRIWDFFGKNLAS